MKIKLYVLISMVISSGCTNNDGGKTSMYFDSAVITKIPISELMDTFQILNKIEMHCAEINSNIYKYKKVEKEVYDESTEGGIVIAYYDNRTLKKLAGTYYGETGKTLMEYYLNDSDFFFVYSKEFYYEKPISMDTLVKIRITEENRYYFLEENLFQWLKENKPVSNDSKEFVLQNKFFKQDFEKYKNLFIK